MTRLSQLVRTDVVGRNLLIDGRQSEAALEIARGVIRLLESHGFACMTELTLANGRRADIVALGAKGEIWIIEVKSSLADFQSDQKWHEYADFCDCFLFAVARDFPREALPEGEGLIIADRYGGEIVREARESKLQATRRKAIMLAFARVAAYRLTRAMDPAAALNPIPRE